MPFKSQAQRAYMYANKPELAKEFESKTPKGEKLNAYAAVKGKKKKQAQQDPSAC